MKDIYAEEEVDRVTKLISDDGEIIILSVAGKITSGAFQGRTKVKKINARMKKEAEEANYGVGDDVPYTITVVIPANVDNTKDVTVHDKLDDVLKFNNDVMVSVNGAAAVAITESGIATLNTNLTDDCSFEIIIETADISAETTLVFTYTAQLTSAAAADQGYVNKAFLDYSDYSTTPETPAIKTFDFNLEKVFTGSDDANYQATFTLDEIKFIKDDTGYVKADSDDQNPSADIVVKNKETVNIRGLAAGTYTLTEKETQSGYNKLESTITVTIDAEGNATFSNVDLVSGADGKVTVTNNSGTMLPSTGGIGTTLFYVIGAALVLGSGILMVSKKRMGAD